MNGVVEAALSSQARGLDAGAAFIDGATVPIAEARTSILDRGFLRADATYDVVGVWEGAFFRLDAHLDRFERGSRELRLELPHNRDEIAAILAEVVRRSGLRAAYVEMICTRGIPPGGSRDPRAYSNRFIAFAVPYVWLFSSDDPLAGMDAVVARTVRRIPPDSIDPTVKNFHWGDLTKALYEAYDRGAHYPVLLDHDGNVTEGPGYNLFSLIDGRLVTPASGVLEGITRRTVIELAREAGIEAETAILPEEQFRRGGEMFATSTAGGVMPITSLDGEPVGEGIAGPLTRRLRDLYWDAHGDPRFATPLDYDD